MSYPNDWNCPISLKLFENPVICDDGNTYERSEIEKWFERPESRAPYDPDMRISPLTKQVISTRLIPNRALKNSIEEYLKNNLSFESNYQNFPYTSAAALIPTLMAPERETTNIEIDVEEELNVKWNGIEYFNVNNNLNANLFFSLVPLNKGEKKQNVYISIVDVSGSMQLPAINEEIEGGYLYSRLDLVKYSLENIMVNCDENDYFSLIIFSNNAEIVVPITRMTQDNKEFVKKKIYEQETQGATNLWSGLLAGLELAKKDVCLNKNVSLILLTDGESNQNPPRGVYATLQQYLERNLNTLVCSINTLGFGYEIDSQLLYDIALKLGNGSFGFIPDCTMIGTNVTSLIARSKTCFAKSVQLKLNIEGGAEWKPEYVENLNMNTNLYNKNTTSYKELNQLINLGQMEYGQERDMMLRLENIKDKSLTSVSLEVIVNTCQGVHKSEFKIQLDKLDYIDQDAINEFNDRNGFICTLIEAINIRRNRNIRENELQNKLKQLIELIKSELKKHNNEKFLREFDNSVLEREGQVSLALLNADWFKKWGLAHLLYLLSSHLRRFNANFKDPSIQKYGGEIFDNNRAECERIFCSLQQPKPSIRFNEYNNYSTVNSNLQKAAASYANRQPVTIASTCCNVDAGCFAGDCHVLMSDGSLKYVSNLLPGDELKCLNDKTSKIKCVLRTKCLKPIKMVKFDSNLLITPYHPIYLINENKWKFPIDIKNYEYFSCDYVYNLVLESEHICIINGIACVTLGHNFNQDVVKHPYFGTNNVINDLMKMKGWYDGYITIDVMLTTRDESTGLINSIIQADDVACNHFNEIIFNADNAVCQIEVN